MKTPRLFPLAFLGLVAPARLSHLITNGQRGWLGADIWLIIWRSTY